MDFKDMPFARQCASAIQEINPVVSYCCYLPCLMLQRASDIFPWQKFSGWSRDSNNTSQTHDKLMLPVDIQRYSSRLKCFKSPWQHSIVPQAY